MEARAGFDPRERSLRNSALENNARFPLFFRRTSRYTDPVVSVSTTLARLALAGYLVNDHLVWLHQQNLVELTSARKVARRSDQWWLLAILITALRDIYQLQLARR